MAGPAPGYKEDDPGTFSDASVTNPDVSPGSVSNSTGDLTYQMAHPWSGDGSAGIQKIDATAMRLFADNLDEVVKSIDAAHLDLKTHANVLKAGNFSQAMELAKAVLGDMNKTTAFTSGTFPVGEGTKSFLENAKAATLELQDAIRQMANLFAETETFNDDQSKRLTEFMVGIGNTIGGPTGLSSLGENYRSSTALTDATNSTKSS